MYSKLRALEVEKKIAFFLALECEDGNIEEVSELLVADDDGLFKHSYLILADENPRCEICG